MALQLRVNFSAEIYGDNAALVAAIDVSDMDRSNNGSNKRAPFSAITNLSATQGGAVSGVILNNIVTLTFSSAWTGASQVSGYLWVDVG